MCAGCDGTAPLIRSLVASGAYVNSRDRRFGRTALMWAISQKHVRVTNVRALIACRADVHAVDRWRRTALWWAAWWGHSSIVRLLIWHCADVNVTSIYGETALIAAAKRGNVAIVQVLLENGARTDDADDWGRTALDWAEKRENKAAAAVLKEWIVTGSQNCGQP